jgi:hypothetical protein
MNISYSEATIDFGETTRRDTSTNSKPEPGVLSMCVIPWPINSKVRCFTWSTYYVNAPDVERVPGCSQNAALTFLGWGFSLLLSYWTVERRGIVAILCMHRVALESLNASAKTSKTANVGETRQRIYVYIMKSWFIPWHFMYLQ